MMPCDVSNMLQSKEKNDTGKKKVHKVLERTNLFFTFAVLYHVLTD